MPMLLERGGETPERWTLIDEAAPLPPEGDVIVPLERLDEAIAAGPALRLGLTLPNDASVTPLRPRFQRLALVRVVFPTFSDGRGFSLARRLRSAGYAGRLRAAGPLIADQFGHLLACGYDEVEVADAVAARQPAEQWLAALGKITRFYQSRPDTAPIAAARHARGA